MNILISRTQEECFSWKQTAVVVDVLRTTATVCALLGKGARPVVVCGKEQIAARWKQSHPSAVVFSEKKLNSVYEDNSPYLASKLPSLQHALVVEEETTAAARALKHAGLVLLGGFCNFTSLCKALRKQDQDVLLVPASLFGTDLQEEDVLCTQGIKNSLQGIGTPQAAVEEFGNTMRFAQFRSSGLQTASKDLNFSLSIDGLPMLPQVSFLHDEEGIACLPYGEKASIWQVADVSDVTDLNPLGQTEKPATAAKQEPAPERTSRLKGFFSGLVRAMKEEKEDLEQSIGRTISQRQSVPSPTTDDPADTLLKKAVRSQEEPQKDRKSVPISDVGTNQVEKDPFGQRSISLDSFARKPLITDVKDHTVGIKISEVGHNEVKKDEFGKNSISLETSPLPQVVQVSAKSNGKKAIVLFSGGLDSTTCLYWALAQGYTCETLTVSYGQRHVREVESARKITGRLGIKHHLIELNLPWLAQNCSLVNKEQPLPDIAVEQIPRGGIPSTYVPGRNLMFLSIAGSLLDAVQAQAIIAGPNAIDFSGYPDCTPAFFKAATEALNRGTKQGVQEGIEVLAPLMHKNKAEIVRMATELKVPFELTWSCYAGGEKPCGHCDSCKLRAKGFEEAGVHDTALD